MTTETPDTDLRYGHHRIRVTYADGARWLLLSDLAAIFPGMLDAARVELDDDDHRNTSLGPSLSIRGAVLASSMLGGATEAGEPEHDFRRWLWSALTPKDATPTSTSAPTDPRQLRVLGVIKRLNGASLSEMSRALPKLRRVDRDDALLALEDRGLIVAAVEDTGGRPSTFYRLAPPTPAP